jgi:hypothetical protein
MANEKTWMSMTAGILDIICGCWALLIAFIFAFMGTIFRFAPIPNVPPFLAPILAAVGIPFVVLGILAIVGGVFALRRKVWGLALAGSIAALFSLHLFFLGIAAIVFTALSKNEFE